jgi:hypothetical protein
MKEAFRESKAFNRKARKVIAKFARKKLQLCVLRGFSSRPWRLKAFPAH